VKKIISAKYGQNSRSPMPPTAGVNPIYIHFPVICTKLHTELTVASKIEWKCSKIAKVGNLPALAKVINPIPRCPLVVRSYKEISQQMFFQCYGSIKET